MDRRDLIEHLRFFGELGVTGLTRNPAWRERATRGVPVPPSREVLRRTAEASAEAGPDDRAREEPADAPAPHGQPEHHAMAEQPDGRPGAVAAQPVPVARSEAEALAAIRTDLGDCTRCKLHALGRTQIVFGTGNPSAELMFVGEAPGADEDIQGEPFVGRAGQQLTKMIEAMGFGRDEVYIANVLKCRPPNNRNPEPDEIERCEPFLFRQIASINPRVIVALGAFAARTLLKTQDPISRLRGRVFDYRGVKLIPTFHPSFLLRSPGYKREAWEDLKLALAELGRTPPVRAHDKGQGTRDKG
jgi:uracil-DNA glycosylase